MKLYLSSLLICCALVSWSQPVQVGQDIDGTGNGDNAGFFVDISSDATIVALAAPNADNDFLTAGEARMFRLNGNTWEQIGSTIFGEGRTDQFSADLEINADGTIAAIGAPGNDEAFGDGGKVRIFEFDGSDWVQKGSSLFGGSGGEGFGLELAVSDSGDRVIIAGPRSNQAGTDAGIVKAFEFDGTDWVQYGSDLTGSQPIDEFGYSMEANADGTILAVAKIRSDSNPGQAGEVTIYEFDGSDWVEKGQRLVGAGTNVGRFGLGLALNAAGTRVAVSDPFDDVDNTVFGGGRVKVFEFDGSQWNQIGQNIDGEESNHELGTTLQLNATGDRLAVSANRFGPGLAGQVRIYDYDGSQWIEKTPFINGEEEGDRSDAIKLDPSGDFIIIGAPGNDDGGAAAGHARVFNIENLLATASFEAAAITVFPNPSNDQLQLAGNDLQGAKIELISASGQLITSIDSFQGNPIDVSNIKSGVYFLRIIVSQGTQTIKISIN